MTNYEQILQQIQADERYERNLDWGEPRKGHPEGTVRAHIAELEVNLNLLRSRLDDADYWKLRILIHTHDTFKANAVRGVPIEDPRSHASIARSFLAAHLDDTELLAMVQYHDEPYALWKQKENRGNHDSSRLSRLCTNIGDWDLFLAFLIVDGCTHGKSREPLQWLFTIIQDKVSTTITMADIIEP